jgi:hypothetical protein
MKEKELQKQGFVSHDVNRNNYVLYSLKTRRIERVYQRTRNDEYKLIVDRGKRINLSGYEK